MKIRNLQETKITQTQIFQTAQEFWLSLNYRITEKGSNQGMACRKERFCHRNQFARLPGGPGTVRIGSNASLVSCISSRLPWAVVVVAAASPARKGRCSQCGGYCEA